jgi:antitoxin component of MazEF toxin-antitoxin module
MRFKLRPVGNSAGIIFPMNWLKKHNLHIGDELIGQDADNSIILTPTNMRKKYKLKDLVAQSVPQELMEEDKKWLDMEDVGEEKVW